MPAATTTLSPQPVRVVTLVASLGGLGAVSTVLGMLPPSFPASVLVVQHGQPGKDPDRLTRLLEKVTPLPVRTALSGQSLHTVGVTVVPHGCAVAVDPSDRLSLVEAETGGCGDATLAAVAAPVGPAAVAVVLTGMLHDGARGVRATKRRGGRVLVQDPATARAAGMPSSAIATGCVDFVLPLHRIGPALVALSMAPGAADLLAVPTPSWAQVHA